MLEKRLYAVPPQAFTADGTADGVVTIGAGGCSLFKVKQKITITATGLPNLNLQIKQIDNNHNIQVGPIPYGKPGVDTSIDARTDISAYTVALGATIFAAEQKRQAIGPDEIARAIYEEEPTVAQRSVLVDECGNKINEANPLPVAATFDGDVIVGTVRVTACDDDPVLGDLHSSIRIAGPNCDNEMEVNDDGSINVNIVDSPSVVVHGLAITHNEISAVASGAETDIILFTAPPGSGYRVTKIDVSGTNIAQYRIRVNGAVVSTLRTYWGDGLNDSFRYETFQNGLLLQPGDIIRVTVIHNRPFAGDFEATMMAS